MITVNLNGRALPSSLLGTILYRVDVLLDGREVLPSKWSLITSSSTVASGDNTIVQFTPLVAVPHTLHVRAVNPEGYTEEAVFTFNVVLPGTGGMELGVKWAKSVFTVGDMLEGIVYAATPEGQPARTLSWVLYRNNVRVSSGTSALVSYPAVDGVYRLSASAYDANGVLFTADSAIAVTQNYEIQSTIAPTVPDSSCILLGAVYTDAIQGDAGSASSLPYQLASYTQELWLLPGTTHVQFDLDPLQNTVDDEVVVRTLTGNWAIVGYPAGLYSESVGYDYRPSEIIPAPADLKMRFTVDAFNVHGASYSAFNFRVRVKCYRNVSTLWRYEQCSYAIHPGGKGMRQRKWALLFSEVDVEVDTDSDFNRYRTGRSVMPYTTPIVTSLPGVALSAAGAPIPVDAATGLVYTEANRYAIYECEGYPELDAKAVAAAEDMRPFTMTLEMPSTPPLIQRIKRLGGVMGIYLSNGAVAEGAVITVQVQTSLASVSFTYATTQGFYANTDEDYVLVGTINIADITDFQFDFNGIVASVYVDESAAVESGLLSGVSVTNQVIVSPRLNRVNVVDVDLAAPGVRVQLTAPSGSLSTERQSTLDFLTEMGAQVAVNAHRFWPFPSTQVAVNLEGVAASNGTVFESFFNAWRIAPPAEGWPALNIDVNNQAAVVYGDPTDVTGHTPLGGSVLYNTVSGNYQVVRNGVPIADVGDAPAPRVGMGVLSNGHLIIVEVDGAQPGFSEGLTVSELGTLMASMGVIDAINSDGGGSATLAVALPVPQVYSSPSVSPPRTVGSSLAIFAATPTRAVPAWGPTHIYSGTMYSLVSFDGACYVNPTRVSTYDGEDIAVIEPLPGDCTNPFCGPVGVYCYTTQCGSIETAHFLQSYNYPSPYMAMPTNPYKCYASPVFVAEGTAYVDPVQGTISLSKQQAISYPDAGLCGDAYIYSPCLGGEDILVVYPCSTATHAFVENNGACYAFSSALPTGTQLPGLNFDAFQNWTVDGRVDLIGSCPVRTLYDLVPGHGMYVDMVGSPGTGTLTSNDTWNLAAGTYRVALDMAGNQRTAGTFSVGVLVGTHGTVFYETGSLMPFTPFEHTFVLSSPETVQLKVYQNDVTPWGGILNAGNLVDNIVFYEVGGGTLLADNFNYFQPPTFNTVVSVGSVTPVLDCADILCTGSTTTGDSYVYEDVETGSRVNVYFDSLDLGVPHFAVSAQVISEGTSGLSSGRVTLHFTKPRQYVMTVAGTGQLRFALGLVGIPKKLILVRGGLETEHSMAISQPTIVLNVMPGDAIYVDVGTPFGGMSKRIAGKYVAVVWVPKVTLPKLYATATLSESGSIRALGFCGLTNRQDYRVYSTLPVDNSTADVVNPDSIVTAQGASSAELVLLRNRTSGDVLPPLPEGLAWYAGETLAQPITFKFYAAREAYGAHGEMDVWVQTAGTFPANLKVSDYKVLSSGTFSERVLPQVDDTSRNSLRVVASTTGLQVPRVYTAPDGEQRSIHSTLPSLVLDGKTFTLNRPDPGISFTVYTP